MFHHLLVPLDGSIHAERALLVAARLARAMGATLTLLRAVSPPEDLIWQPIGPLREVAEVHKQEQIRATEYVQRVAALEMFAGLQVVPITTEGDPFQRILAEVQTKQADLIVMCSHGETGFKRWALGSVSLKVARQSAVPVLLLRPTVDDLTHALPQQVRVLVPLDGSPLAEEALAPALALTEALSAPEPGWLHLIGVVPLFTPDLMTSDTVQAAMEDGQGYLTSMEQRLLRQTAAANANVTIGSSVVMRQDVAHALAELAEIGDGVKQREGLPAYDMIAMATHGRSGLSRWALGSVTERVLDTIKLPVLIVRPQPAVVRIPAKQKDRDPAIVSWPGLL